MTRHHCADPGRRARGRAASRTGFVSAVALVAMAGGAAAQSGPSTVTMTCAQARSLVVAHGGIVLATGGYTYERFVAHAGACFPTQTTKAAWAPALDTPQCFIGYTCVEAEHKFR
jgi:hypothetical protein